MNPEAATAAASLLLARKIIFRAMVLCLILPMHVMYTDAWIVGSRVVVPTRNFLPSHIKKKKSWRGRSCSVRLHESSSENTAASSNNNVVKMNELNDMDVVVYSLLDDEENNNNKLYLGAVQDDGGLSPLSAWTDEPAFGDSIEFLVDEVDRFSLAQQTEDQRKADDAIDKGNDDANNHTIRIHHLLSEEEVSYGQRQCPRGVHNPHGEESEMLYYVDQQLIDEFQIRMEVKPELETLW
jgi:hypothetical protein